MRVNAALSTGKSSKQTQQWSLLVVVVVVDGDGGVGGVDVVGDWGWCW